MKKILAITLALCLMLTIFTGCNKVEAPQAAEPTTESAQTPAEAVAVVEPAQATEVLPVAELSAAEPVTDKPAVAEAKPEDTKQLEQKPTEPVKAEEKTTTVTFTDSLGKTITLNKNPQKVVCLYTSYLDLWDMAGGKVVGRADSKENVPAAAKDAETIGLYTNPNLEKILALQPDLILINSDVSSQVALIPIFEKNNIPYAALKYDTFKDYLKLLKLYTDLTEREDLYKTKGLDVEKKVDAIIAKVPKNSHPSILLLLGSSKSISVRLPNTTVGEMLQDLGTVNVAYDPKLKAADMEVFSMEKVIEKDPVFIFAQTMGDVEESTARIKKDIEANPAWSYLYAVKQGNYIFLPKDLFLFKPNDRYAEAYEKLAKILYPEIFN